MTFKFEQLVTQELDLTKEESRRITKEYLRSLVGFNNYLRTDKGKAVVKEDDPNHRHGSISEEYVRDATEMDIAIFKLLELMK